ncbi:Oidioi.mRNA.OKI2018_I69.chr2.g5927.t1.cds [Oikopleura dioica]|uniref:Oidioi.mRNA.OKI2018_I69.chr2.g5927.t1.cds n=1 Tax=Oikopleura dioica TaxID=34765 RepID=A0ABN7T7I6_OIKDI|nr:Oidioi.mRNA.OKI2018_I69.chr2.g5927.t1.cds [Oikopleura dioica]
MNAFYPYSYYQASSLPVAWGTSEATATGNTLPWETSAVLASASQAPDQVLNSSVGSGSPTGSPPPPETNSTENNGINHAQFAQAQLYQQAYQNWNYAAQGYQQAAATGATAWQQNPSAPAPNRTRTRDKYRVVYSNYQRVELEKEYNFNKYITIRRKVELSKMLDLSERQVKIWFQNRRAKERKMVNKSGNTSTDSQDLSEEEKSAPETHSGVEFSDDPSPQQPEDHIDHMINIIDVKAEPQTQAPKPEIETIMQSLVGCTQKYLM